MNINDHIYFAPNVLLKDLDLVDKISLISAFEKRVNKYFLDAIKLLNEQDNAYASAIIEFSMIDALAKYTTKKNTGVKERITKILQDNFAINESLAERAYDEFRNGLLHENHIKNSGQLCYGTSNAFEIQKERLIINPRKLETKLGRFFKSYIENLQTDKELYSLFLSHIKEDFEEEIAFFNKTN
ncbi:MAG: hypothetical protein LBV43_11945 [Prevotella sp.]|jgi:hypothetical protein|nr:hypothetical protein [Prevotella sp.]